MRLSLCHRHHDPHPIENTDARLGDRTWLSFPNLASIFKDGAVAGKLTGARDVDNGLFRPALPVSIKAAHSFMGLTVRLEIGQMQVMVAVREKGFVNRIEDPRLMAVELL